MTSLATALLLMDEVRGEAERAAAERDGRAEFFDAAPEALLVTDAAAVIRHANGAAARLLGRAGRFLPGKPLACFVPLAERRAFRRYLLRLDVKASWRCSAFEIGVRRASPPGALCWVLR